MTQKVGENASDVKSQQIFEFLSVPSTYVRVRMKVRVKFLWCGVGGQVKTKLWYQTS